MRNNLAIVLAVIALGLSVWSVTLRPVPQPPRRPGPADPAAAAHLTALPKIDPDNTADCGANGATSLRSLMHDRINPTMTHLSFALHHDQSDAAVRWKAVADNAARLLGCIHLAPSVLPADIGIAGLPDYFRFLGNMQENALGVQSAAMEQDGDGALHWFRHLKQDCVACHSRFRIEPTIDHPGEPEATP